MIWRTRVVILYVQRQGREGGSYREREGEGERDNRVIWCIREVLLCVKYRLYVFRRTLAVSCVHSQSPFLSLVLTPEH